MTERQLLERIRSLARRNAWHIYHTHDSRRSERGFPDLVLIRDQRLLVAELKSEKGKLRPGQTEWLRGFAGVGAETYIWRPVHWTNGTIRELLA